MCNWRGALLRFFRPSEWCRRENAQRLSGWRLDCDVAKRLNQPPPPPPNTVIVKP